MKHVLADNDDCIDEKHIEMDRDSYKSPSGSLTALIPSFFLFFFLPS